MSKDIEEIKEDVTEVTEEVTENEVLEESSSETETENTDETPVSDEEEGKENAISDIVSTDEVNHDKIKINVIKERRMGAKAKGRLGIIIKNIILALLAIIWLIPILWLLVSAFNVDPGINYAHFFPSKGWTTDNFAKLFEENSAVMYKQWFLNTLMISTCTCIISTIFVIMVSFAFSCLRFDGRKAFMGISMVINMFPGVLSMIAVYFIMKSIGLTESHIGMILVYSAGSGLGYLIVKGYMDTLPLSLREAAKLEGASEFDVLMKVTLPLCKPIIVYQVISSFLMPWGDFVFAKLMLGHDVKNFTIAIGLYNMLSKENLPRYFSQFCAGGILISIPISILFLIMQKYYVEGVTSGSTKG